jgi:hypothetical protein
MIREETNLEYIGTFGNDDIDYIDLANNNWLISLTVFPFYRTDGAFSPICLNRAGNVPFTNWDGSETEVKVN